MPWTDCGCARNRVVVFPSRSLLSNMTMLLFCYFITCLCCILFILWNIFVLQCDLLHACGSKIHLLPDQILLSSSFNAHGSWNIRHQIRAVSNSAEWMVLLLQGLTYHCHERSKTIYRGGHCFLLLKEISKALGERSLQLCHRCYGLCEELQLFLQGNVSTTLWHLYCCEASAAIVKGQDEKTRG